MSSLLAFRKVTIKAAVPYETLFHFPLIGGFAAGEWKMEKRARKVAPYVAANVRLPRASRGHPSRCASRNMAVSLVVLFTCLASQEAPLFQTSSSILLGPYRFCQQRDNLAAVGTAML